MIYCERCGHPGCKRATKAFESIHKPKLKALQTVLTKKPRVFWLSRFVRWMHHLFPLSFKRP